VIGHNLETVPRLYAQARCHASYTRSLDVLALVKQMKRQIWTKSGIMLGLGEKKEEVLQVLHDLRRVDCDFLTIGQYLQPTGAHCKVVEYVPPEIFDHYGEIAREMGFLRVLSCPLARSSYRAEEMLRGL
jgi:lipoic acid synthetase